MQRNLRGHLCGCRVLDPDTNVNEQYAKLAVLWNRLPFLCVEAPIRATFLDDITYRNRFNNKRFWLYTRSLSSESEIAPPNLPLQCNFLGVLFRSKSEKKHSLVC